MKKNICCFFLLIILFFLPLAGKVWAATFILDPSSASAKVGEPFVINLLINPENRDIINAEAVLSYNPAMLEVDEVATVSASFFPIVRHKIDVMAGELRVLGNIGAHGRPISSTNAQPIVAISLRLKKPGNSLLSFKCSEGETTDSNIFASRYGDVFGEEDVIDCSRLKGGLYSSQPGENIVDQPSCDPCGYCQGGEKPADWEKCQACIAQGGKTWTPIGCISNTASGFVQSILRILVPLVGGLAFLGIILGSFILLTSQGDSLGISHGKNIIVGSIGALLLILFAVFLLKLIGFNILGLAGFG